jgi:predicted lipoprotein with Yx(FWY)xxD motif
MVGLPGLLVALLMGPAAAQDAGSALSTILETMKGDPYGTYLVTAEGRPLYMFSADTPRSGGRDAKSSCSDACVREWLPLIAGAGAVASPDIDIALIGKTKRQDGPSQVVFGGHPIYLFAGDQPEGPPMGHGHSAYGGVWQLMAPDGSPIPPSG